MLKLALPIIVVGLSACGGGNDSADAGSLNCVGALSSEWIDENGSACTLPWNESSPAFALTECGEVGENCSNDGPAPDFTCLDTPPAPGPVDPASVTLTGFVDVFSSGPNSNAARLEVYRESQLAGGANFDAVTPIATTDVVLDASTLTDARACPAERDVNRGECLLVLAQDNATCGGGCDKELSASQFCFVETASCEDLQRWEVRYEVSNIPTNEFLVIRTVGLDNQGQPEVLGNTWAQMVQTNVYLAANDRACSDIEDTDCIDIANTTYQKNANLLSAQDYATIPTSAGLSAGIASGHGAVAGEIHDCQRRRIQHVQVGFSVGDSPRVLVYFNGNPVKTLPRLQRSTEGTNALGLYSGLDMEPGEVTITGIGVDQGALRSAGRFTTRVWADSVTLVTIGAGRPQQD